MRLADFKISKKLICGFGAVLLVVALSSAFVFAKIQEVKEIERLSSAADRAIDLLDQTAGDLSGIRAAIRKYVLTGNPGDKQKLDAVLAEHDKDLSDAQTIVVDAMPEMAPAFEDHRAQYAEYLKTSVVPEVEAASDPSTRAKAVAMVAESKNSLMGDAAEKSFQSLRASTSAWSDRSAAKSAAAMAMIQTVSIASGVISVLTGIGMAWLIMRAIAGPIVQMTAAMKRLASGDHGVVVPAVGQKDEVGEMASAVQTFKDAAIEKARLEAEAGAARVAAEAERTRVEAERAAAADELARVVDSIGLGLDQLAAGTLTYRLKESFARDYEKLRGDFNGVMDKLAAAMTAVASNTAAIRSGSSEISSAANDLSRRTEQQAASLEETAAALDEITATVRKTAQGASQARKMVSEAKTDAERSGEIVGRAVEAMTAIEKSSAQISQIIGVIDEIAFQTNLLALNAGVEAARAGEAGKGFAVVASEVRGLAQRSAEAAKEIKALIHTSGEQVSDGVSLVGDTGKALVRIVAQVAEINGIVADIAASAQEQATALDEVNTAINQMDQVTQQNAAMVEESTAASQSLQQETEELVRLVGNFEVGDVTAAPSVLSTRRPVATPPLRGTPVPTLKVTGRGGAARKPEPASGEWQEF